VGRKIADSIVKNKELAASDRGLKRGKIWLTFGVFTNLLLLGYYKYSHFAGSTIATLFNLHVEIPNPALPLGISFYTFTQIAYLVDTWRGDARKDRLATYSLFVTFFPHLIAGPILHHKKIIPQFHNPANFYFSHPNMTRGLAFLVLGLAKKVLIADSLSSSVAAVFGNAADVSFIEAWLGALCYTLQIYFDFSGYSDMAVGLGWMLNIEIPFNFNSPYKSTSLIDFWRRWHMSLSQFLKDYLYIPLGGNRLGEARRYVNLFITMLLGGLWHGAGFTFILWGAWHGAFLTFNHFWRKLKFKLPRFVGWALTFLIVVMAWVSFRASSIHDAFEILKCMLGLKGIMLTPKYGNYLSWLSAIGFEFTGNPFTYLPEAKAILLKVISLTVFVVILPNSQELVEKIKPNVLLAFGLALVCAISLMLMNNISEFLYFQF